MFLRQPSSSIGKRSALISILCFSALPFEIHLKGDFHCLSLEGHMFQVCSEHVVYESLDVDLGQDLPFQLCIGIRFSAFLDADSDRDVLYYQASCFC